MSSNIPLYRVNESLSSWFPFEKQQPTGDVKILMTGQQTPGALKELCILLAKSNAKTVITTEPEFNVKHRSEGWRDQPRVVLKAPVFGPKISIAAVKLTTELNALGALQGLLCKPADFSLNDVFIGSKLPKIKRVAEEAEKRGWLTIGANIREFVELAKMCRSPSSILAVPEDERSAYTIIKDMSDWNAFLKSAGIADNWIDLLHFNDVAKLFGATQEQCKILCAIEIVPADVEKNIKAEKLDVNGLRLLSKMVGMLSCDMCLTDYVNLAVFYASGGNMPDTEAGVVECLELLTKNISKPEYVKTLASICIMICDAEGDDEHARVLLQYINAVQGNSTMMMVQLPEDTSFNWLAQQYHYVGCGVFRDDESRNGEAIVRLYK